MIVSWTWMEQQSWTSFQVYSSFRTSTKATMWLHSAIIARSKETRPWCAGHQVAVPQWAVGAPCCLFSIFAPYHDLLQCSFCNFCSFPLFMGCCWACFSGISGAGTHRSDLRKQLAGSNCRILLPTLTILHTGPALTTAARV